MGCIHLHILQSLWKFDLETSSTSLWAHFRSPEEDERWVRKSHNVVGLLLVWRDHVNNASEAYLVCLQVCLQIYIRREMRLMTPFCYKVGKYLLQALFSKWFLGPLVLITFMATPADWPGWFPGRYVLTPACSWKITDRIILRDTEVMSRLWGHEICFCGETDLRRPWWEHGISALPSLWRNVI